jgi:hypothetical protein
MSIKRIQLQRRSGWRMPENTVKVDRSTRWGNPMRIGPGYSAADAVADYVRWIQGESADRFSAVTAMRPSIAEIRLQLANKNLACWCAIGQPCHADVLLRLANLPELT